MRRTREWWTTLSPEQRRRLSYIEQALHHETDMKKRARMCRERKEIEEIANRGTPKDNTKAYETLEFIRDFIEKEGYSPAFHEIADGMGWKDQSSARGWCGKLKDMGLITWTPWVPRSIEVIEK